MFITLASTKMAFSVVVAHVLCYGKFRFPLTYNGKSENLPLLLFHCRYFETSFTEMFFEYSSTKHTIFV